MVGRLRRYALEALKNLLVASDVARKEARSLDAVKQLLKALFAHKEEVQTKEVILDALVSLDGQHFRLFNNGTFREFLYRSEFFANCTLLL